MFIRKRERKLILAYLFTEGVMTAPKNYNTHFVIEAASETNDGEVTVPNLQVIKLMQSLDSKGYVRTTFNWSHYYWFLTDEGVEYLREFLHLPADVKPLTEMKTIASAPVLGGRDEGRSDRRGGYGRGGYGDRPRRDGPREGGFGRFRNRDEGGYRRREDPQ